MLACLLHLEILNILLCRHVGRIMTTASINKTRPYRISELHDVCWETLHEYGDLVHYNYYNRNVLPLNLQLNTDLVLMQFLLR